MEKLSGPTLASQLVDAEAGACAGRVAAEVHAAMHARTEQSLQTMRVQFAVRMSLGHPPSSDEPLLRMIEAGLT